MNGNEASFANVVSPFHLYQCKHVSDGEKCVFDLKEEGRKCGILKEDKNAKKNIGWAIFCVLIENWQNNIGIDQSDSTTEEENRLALIPDGTRKKFGRILNSN
jgi:hypothetical protein